MTERLSDERLAGMLADCQATESAGGSIHKVWCKDLRALVDEVIERRAAEARWADVRARWLALYDGQDRLAEQFPALGEALCKAVYGLSYREPKA